MRSAGNSVLVASMAPKRGCNGGCPSRAAFYPQIRACRTAVLTGLLGLAGSRYASAQTQSVWIEVMKDSESAQCPDALTILSTARALFPQKDLPSAVDPQRAGLSVQVTIRRTSEGHEGWLIAGGAHQGQRRIVDPDEDCRGLAHALAVALVLLIEPSTEPPAPRPVPTPQPLWPAPNRMATGQNRRRFPWKQGRSPPWDSWVARRVIRARLGGMSARNTRNGLCQLCASVG